MEHILVVDDMFDYRNLIKLILASEGFRVYEARNGIEALESLEQNKDIKLVLLDMKMPGMDGFETIDAINQRYQNSSHKPKICILSASDDKKNVLKALKMGAQDYLVKPVNRAILIETVKDLLNDPQEKIESKEALSTDISAFDVESQYNIEFRLNRLSVTKVEFNSPVKLKIGSLSNLYSEALHKVIGLSNIILRCRVVECKQKDDRYIVYGSIQGLPECDARHIRKLLTEGRNFDEK